jgi:hypothetical protein
MERQTLGGGAASGRRTQADPPPQRPLLRRSHSSRFRRQMPLVPVRRRRRSSLAALACSHACRALAARSCKAFRRRRNAEILAASIEDERRWIAQVLSAPRSSVAASGSAAAGTGLVRRVRGSRCPPCPGRSSSSSQDCRSPASNSCAASAPRHSQMVKPTTSNVRTFAGTSDRRAAVAHEQPYHTPTSRLRVPGRPAIIARAPPGTLCLAALDYDQPCNRRQRALARGACAAAARSWSSLQPLVSSVAVRGALGHRPSAGGRLRFFLGCSP